MLFIRLISRLPLWFLYILSDVLFVLAFYLVRYRRKIVWKNLTHSFPEKTTQELIVIERDFYRNLCDQMAETVKAITISESEFRKRMVFRDCAVAEQYAKSGQSVIVLASHQFNWEWLVSIGNASFPMPIDYVYQKQTSVLATRFSLAVRSRFGAFPIERESVARESIKRRDKLRAIAIVADQYPGHGDDKHYYAQFLNQETVFFHGMNQLAYLLQYPVLAARMVRLKRGYYAVDFPELTSPPYEKDSKIVMEQYVNFAEDMIRKHPAGWLWSHNRWKNRHKINNQ